MTLVNTDFIDDAKTFLRLPEEVTVYDNEINGLIDSAIQTLEVAGVGEVKSPLVTEYVKTYVRLRMMQDASEGFTNSEKSREAELLSTLTYGGL